MFYTLDRIEDENIAVLIDDGGKKADIPFSLLPPHSKPGDVFRSENGAYIFDEKETQERRLRISDKRNRFFNKMKNK